MENLPVGKSEDSVTYAKPGRTGKKGSDSQIARLSNWRAGRISIGYHSVAATH
jgi:hypothetical protein